MSILVTGASGFLGKKLLRRLVANKKKVIAIDTKKPKSSFYNNPNIKWILCNLVDDVIDIKNLKDLEAVVHLAGATLGAGEDESLFLAANEATTVKLMQATAKRCKKFILASSQVVYGDIENINVLETLPLIENHSAYGCSKLNTENWMRWFHSNAGGNYIFLRFCGFIDGRGIIDYMVDQAIKNKPIELFSKGKICRDYLPSKNGIDAIIKAIESDLRDGVFEINIGSGQSIPSYKLAKIICSEINSSSKIVLSDKPAPQSSFVYSVDKAKKILNFEPNNLTESVRYYAKERKNQENT